MLKTEEKKRWGQKDGEREREREREREEWEETWITDGGDRQAVSFITWIPLEKSVGYEQWMNELALLLLLSRYFVLNAFYLFLVWK